MLVFIPEIIIWAAYMALYLTFWNVSQFLEDFTRDKVFEKNISQRSGLFRPLSSKDYYVHSQSQFLRDDFQPLVSKLTGYYFFS